MKKLSVEAIEGIPALARINEIQQRINEIEKKFGVEIPHQDFQKTLENEMAKLDSTKKIKPIEEFLAENKLQPIEDFLAKNKIQPVNENAAANAKKVATALKPTENLAVVDTFNPDETNFENENLRESTPNYSSSRRYENSSPYSTEGMIESAARKFGVDSGLVKAIATAESNMNQSARSNVGAVGVMQLMPETAGSLGVDPYDEKQNIEGGTHYLRQMLDKFNGNLQYAIAAYNAGPGAVQKYGGVPPYSETQNYVGRVMDFYVK